MIGKTINILDTFCGAGGSSTGAVFAIEELGHRPSLTCVNHNKMAIATHTVNHPWARHYCTGVDDLNLESMYGDTLLDVLWSSPSCRNHSSAKGGSPINDQDRATGWCVVRIAETLRPPVILIENVPAFLSWGACERRWSKKLGQWVLFPDAKRKGETFRAWVEALKSLGYKVDYRILCCADYGDPTTRERLFIQCVSGRRKIVWPNPTHIDPAMIEKMKDDLFAPDQPRMPWLSARDIIDWTLEGASIFKREKSLVEKTLRRIFLGLDRIGLKEFKKPSPFITIIDARLEKVTGGEFLVRQMGQSIAEDINSPLSTVVGGPKHYIGEPFLAKLRGTGTTSDINKPTPTVTGGGTHLGLVETSLCAIQPSERNKGSKIDPLLKRTVEKVLGELKLTNFTYEGEWHETGRPIIRIAGERYVLEILFRMLQPHELAAAQGFPKNYQFEGTKTEIIKQIGNAVPCNTARALVKATLTQNPNVGLPAYDWIRKDQSLTFALMAAHGEKPTLAKAS